ncbi:hypothetical protein BGZ75_009810 [Mortierella antarctica]|nr:hypothetical protein BGZ75_009810 [Mortierella antarctica]
MKFTTALVLIVSCIAVAAAHGGLLYPPPRGGIDDTKQYNGRFHAFLGFKDKKHKLTFPCGGYAPGPVTELKAGETVKVRFYASDMDRGELEEQPKKPVEKKKQFKQARHGGGMCEFSLSYDNGETFHLIGRYTKTCPDSYYPWPVKIPDNVKECKDSKCLFVWTWTANILPQFYMNCADIRLTGRKTMEYKTKEKVGFYDFKYRNRKIPQGVRAEGDGFKHEAGRGPLQSEIDGNRKGNYPKPALIRRK